MVIQSDRDTRNSGRNQSSNSAVVYDLSAIVHCINRGLPGSALYDLSTGRHICLDRSEPFRVPSFLILRVLAFGALS
jgi:hypothetical protein